MNLLVIVSDTLRRDHLGCYGNPTVRTPNLDRLAAQSVLFDQALSGSFPTLPCRAELFTGRFVFTYLNWGPLPRRAVILSQTLAQAGYTSALVTDNLPLSRDDYWYDRGFHSRRRVRGQWYDTLRPKDAPFEWPCPAQKLRSGRDGRMQQYLRNVHGWTREEEYFTPRVVEEAVDWLERNHDRGPWFLHVDLFDPHEPWDPPRKYADQYSPAGDGDDIIYPAFGRADQYTEADLKRMRALYAGEVTLVDTCVGRLLGRVEELGHREDTVVVFLSDHGILLGERGLLGKMGGTMRSLLGWPPYAELARIPMMVRAPGIGPGRSDALVHPGDLTPTLLELAGVPVPGTMNTSSLLPILRGELQSVRDLAVSSWSLRGWSPHRPSVIRTQEWSLVYWRAGVRPELYHRKSDPEETRDVYGDRPAEARELHRRYVDFIRANGAPVKHLLPRLLLADWGRHSRESLFHPASGPSGD